MNPKRSWDSHPKALKLFNDLMIDLKCQLANIEGQKPITVERLDEVASEIRPILEQGQENPPTYASLS